MTKSECFNILPASSHLKVTAIFLPNSAHHREHQYCLVIMPPAYSGGIKRCHNPSVCPRWPRCAAAGLGPLRLHQLHHSCPVGYQSCVDLDLHPCTAISRGHIVSQCNKLFAVTLALLTGANSKVYRGMPILGIDGKARSLQM